MNFSIGFESGFSKNVLTRNINLKKKAVKKKKKK
jgi:hypothetical protein